VSKSTRPPKLPGRSQVTRRSSPVAASAFGDLVDSGRLRTVALDAIVPNPRQPRTRFAEEELAGLASSIRERGVLQPPVVRQVGETYELVAGERRWRAARLAGRLDIEVLVGDHHDDESLLDALMENVAREDLSPVEAARAYATIIDDLGITREELGQRVGQSRVSISNHIRLLDLPDAALDFIDSGDLTFAHGRALLLCDDHATRLRLARRAVNEQWSTRQLEAAARAEGAPRARRPTPPADGEAYAQRASDIVASLTGLDVRVRAAANGTVALTLSDRDALATLVTKLGAPSSIVDELATQRDPAPTS
jgi:ParB family transcriptional regulator, chromosome partitioning protein